MACLFSKSTKSWKVGDDNAGMEDDDDDDGHGDLEELLSGRREQT